MPPALTRTPLESEAPTGGASPFAAPCHQCCPSRLQPRPRWQGQAHRSYRLHLRTSATLALSTALALRQLQTCKETLEASPNLTSLPDEAGNPTFQILPLRLIPRRRPSALHLSFASANTVNQFHKAPSRPKRGLRIYSPGIPGVKALFWCASRTQQTSDKLSRAEWLQITASLPCAQISYGNAQFPA